ncbi:DUF6443 domain-containing protein, partial [Mucilaginibacter sp.]
MYNRKLICGLFSFLFLFFIQQARAQQGLVQQDIIKIPGITADNQIYSLGAASKQTTISYVDGLGRAIQTVAVTVTPLGNDIVQPIVYDNLGRQTMNYLPYADLTTGSTSDPIGSYRANAISGQSGFYSNGNTDKVQDDANPYSQQVFENSPLQRLLQSGMVGNGYQPVVGTGTTGAQYYKNISYRTNLSTTDGNIIVWGPDGSNTDSFYADNTLSVTDGKDEDNLEGLTFTDHSGRLILKRQVISSTQNNDTYYVYNNAGFLLYIVPPKAVTLLSGLGSTPLTSAPVDSMIFAYTYDDLNHGRIITRTTPGAGTVNIVYDPYQRPILVQDANMALRNKWNYIKYDAKGRAISQGIYLDASHIGQVAMQAWVNTNYGSYWYESRSSTSATGYYTDNVFPQSSITPLSYAYFDDYDLNEDVNHLPDYSYSPQSLPNDQTETPTLAAVKGAPTMIMTTTVGEGFTAGQWLLKVMFYDKRGNIIQVQSNNLVNPTYSITTLSDISTNVPNFIGMPTITKSVKVTGTGTTNTVSVYTKFTYDNATRLHEVDQAYDAAGNNYSVVGVYNYNEMGQLVTKNLGSVGTAGSVPATLSLNSTYSGNNTFTATNSITLTANSSTNFSVPAGSTFNAFISNGYLQSIEYRYNIRGQLTSINNSTLTNDSGTANTNDNNNDLFGMQLFYDQQDAGGLNNTTYHNGRLTGVKWMTNDKSTPIERGYNYTYNTAGQFTGSAYGERTTAGTGTFTNQLDAYSEKGITYDENGNITALTRNTVNTSGAIVVADNLTYNYDNVKNYNRLLTVGDAGATNAGFQNYTGNTTTAYVYDNNGNLFSDPYKGLTNYYNDLNKTDHIVITTGSGSKIYYTYDGSGNVIRKRQYTAANVLQTTTDYVDGFVYIQPAGSSEALAYFPMPEGRVTNAAGTLTQEFIITDQQGNARISFNNTGPGGAPKLIQENNYYGFGMALANDPILGGNNKNLYNGGSEWQNDNQPLPDYYQTPNRNYDPELGRFISTDPMAESAESMTPYQYARNNPVMNNDPSGNYSLPIASGGPVGAPTGGANTGGAIFGAPGGAPVWDDGNEQDYLDYTEDQLESSDYYQAQHGNIAAIGR